MRNRGLNRRGALACAAALTVALAASALAATPAENYAKKCRKCHGADGTGNGPAAAVLDVHPGNFTDCAKMASHDHAFLVKIITEGGKSVGKSEQMPAHKNKLSPEEIDALATYVATHFCPKGKP